MIIDCFTFFNEYDILEGRLEYLFDRVDYFLIIEANLSFSGKIKPFNYINNISRYKKYADKIIYFPIDIPRNDYIWEHYPGRHPKYSDPEWQVEFRQRNHIGHALKLFPEDSVAIISDVDEIPNRDKLEEAIAAIETAPAVSMEQKVLVYNLNRFQPGTWCGPVVAKSCIVTNVSAQHCRDSRFFNMPRISNGGWHLTYWGDVAEIQTKIQNFAHQENNVPEYTDIDLIRKRMNLNLHPLEPMELIEKNVTLSVPVNDQLPSSFFNVFKKYQR
jgi:beta-1,4-mannosyl-glycoprotein beta-1,4-N-acetylglucosaminyltransferase